MGNYDGGGQKRGKWGYCRRYRDNDKIEALHSLYEEPKDNDDDGCDNDVNDDGNWDDVEEKEREEEDDYDYGVVVITAVQLFGMPD